MDHIRDDKRDFRWRKVVIMPGGVCFGSWEEVWQTKVLDFRLARAHTPSFEGAYAGVLRIFQYVHNFRFDTRPEAALKVPYTCALVPPALVLKIV